jgi:hypothetical protein
MGFLAGRIHLMLGILDALANASPAEQVDVMQYLHSFGSVRGFIPDPFAVKAGHGHAGCTRSSTLLRSGVTTPLPRFCTYSSSQRMR